MANSFQNGSHSAISELGSSNCPQGTFSVHSKSIKVDFEQGEAKNCDGIPTEEPITTTEKVTTTEKPTTTEKVTTTEEPITTTEKVTTTEESITTTEKAPTKLDDKCCQTMIVTDHIPGYEKFAGKYIIEVLLHNDNFYYTRTDGLYYLSFSSEWDEWEFTKSSLASEDVESYIYGELDTEYNCIQKNFEGAFQYWVDNADIDPYVAAGHIYCAEKADLIPAHTKCWNNQFQDNNGRNEIVNGVEATPHSWMWIASLESSSESFCGASIINREWVLTAAHCCVDSDFSENGYVIVGHHDMNDVSDGVGNRLAVLEIHIHDDYDAEYLTNDICLLKVEQIKLSDSTGIVCLPDPGDHVIPHVTNKCFVAGWGLLEYDNSTAPSKLQSVGVNIYSDEYCMKHASTDTTAFLKTDYQFCAGHLKGGKDACQGDSGGPLICVEKGEPVQYGITSWGVGCAEPNNPGVYTQLAHYIDWMKETINGKIQL